MGLGGTELGGGCQNTHSVVTTAGADVVLKSGRLPPEDGIAVVQSTAGLSIDKCRVVNGCVVPESDV